VLSILFHNSFSDFITCRLVCRQWSRQGAQLYQDRKSFSMTSGGTTDGRRKDYQHFTKLVKCLKGASFPLVNKFFLNQYIFEPEKLKFFNEFMKVCGPTVTELSLRFDPSSCAPIKKRCLPSITLGKLKKLKFACGKWVSNVDIPNLLESLLCAGPVLVRYLETSTRHSHVSINDTKLDKISKIRLVFNRRT